jgi:hypothetical protein
VEASDPAGLAGDRWPCGETAPAPSGDLGGVEPGTGTRYDLAMEAATLSGAAGATAADELEEPCPCKAGPPSLT